MYRVLAKSTPEFRLAAKAQSSPCCAVAGAVEPGEDFTPELIDAAAAIADISVTAGACAFLFLTLPAHGQTSSGRSPGHPPNVSEAKDPAAILEIGALTTW